MRFIEIGNTWVSWRHNLSVSDLRMIGDFTAENILNWLKTSISPYISADPLFSGATIVSFHAVCDDEIVDWETDEPWTPFDGTPVKYGNNPPIVYDTIYPKRVKS